VSGEWSVMSGINNQQRKKVQGGFNRKGRRERKEKTQRMNSILNTKIDWLKKVHSPFTIHY
jgi:hypothetical protein